MSDAKFPEFRRERLIRFSDCDPAAIVFYPQYFVMFNGLVEDWVNEELGIGYHRLIGEQRVGLPIVRLEADFRSVSRLGDRVILGMTLERLGTRSLTLAMHCFDDAGLTRMRMQQVLVTTSLETHRAVDIPANMRAAILRGAIPA